MKLGFAMPHMVRIKAMTQSWEAAVTGADQTRLAKWAEKLGYVMLAVPEHHITPRERVEVSGPHYLNAYTAMAHFAGDGIDPVTAVTRCCRRRSRSSPPRRC